MLWLAVIFLLVALAAYYFGQGEVGGVAIKIAWACFIIFVILLVLNFVLGMSGGPGGYWGWPVR